MLNLFLSSRKQLERRMIKLCLNTEKPEALATANRLERPDLLARPVAALEDADPVVLNTIGRRDQPAAPGQARLIGGTKAR
jgi:hypothetical protein